MQTVIYTLFISHIFIYLRFVTLRSIKILHQDTYQIHGIKTADVTTSFTKKTTSFIRTKHQCDVSRNPTSRINVQVTVGMFLQLYYKINELAFILGRFRCARSNPIFPSFERVGIIQIVHFSCCLFYLGTWYYS